MKYTYADVIIDPNDKRLEGAIGKRVYLDSSALDVLRQANEKGIPDILTAIHKDEALPYQGVNYCHPFVIIKKKPEVKYVPFDLSKVEDRDFLRGKWIRHKMTGDEYQITSLSKNLAIGTTGKELLKYYTFIDCSPVGKKVEK